MHRTIPLFVSCWLPTLAAAQVDNQLGFDSRAQSTQADRLGASAVAADCLHHFDRRDYRDWLLDPADPTGTTFRFRALRFWLQDQEGSTLETFALVGYPESPTTPDFPDVGSPWFRSGPIPLPAAPGPGPIAWAVTITMPSNAPSLPQGDVWLGVHLPLPVGQPWPLDGLSLHFGVDGSAGPTIASLPNGQVACHVPVIAGVPTGPAVYATSTFAGRRQLRFEVVADTTGGVCIARRGLVESTNFLSGLYPDIYDASGATPPRYDDLGFVVAEANLPNAPLFVAVAFGGNPAGSPPIASLGPLFAAPGTRGNVCIDVHQAAVFFLTTDGNGIADFHLPLTMPVRTAIQAMSSPTAPFDLWYQGFVLNPNGPGPALEVRATGCGVQHL